MATLYERVMSSTAHGNRVCDRCGPFIASYASHLGLSTRNRERADAPDITLNLKDAVQLGRTCWHCSWLVLVGMSALMQLGAKVPPTAAEIENAHFKWLTVEHSLQTGPGEGMPLLTRLAISYGPGHTTKDTRRVVLSKCGSGRPKELTELLEQGRTIGDGDDGPYAGRFRPPVVDARLFKHWKERCLRDHSGVCDQNPADNDDGFVKYIRLIDVVEKRITHGTRENRWVALSYCWGEPQEHSLKSTNIDRYQQKGSLTEQNLPRGIIDAMNVTLAIGERYLWVDSLCIVQDRDDDKLEYISIMGAIYAHAVVTIVNAANPKVSLGLPGVDKSNSRREQLYFQGPGFWLVEALDPPSYRLMNYSNDSYLEDSVWNTRGWTFQEGLLSSRCLIFTAEQVYWQCKKATWCEDSFWEDASSPQIYRHFSGRTMLGSITDLGQENWMQLYRDVVKAYSERQLSSEGDRLGAVDGILQVLQRADEKGYSWGMPIDHMEYALAWASNAYTTRRDCDCLFLDPKEGVSTSPYPTWSWIGWHGYIDMPVVDRLSLGGRIGLKFYVVGRDREPRALVETPFAGAERDFTKKEYLGTQELHEQIGYPRGYKFSWADMSRTSVSSGDIPTAIVKGADLLPSLLCFWTSTATLKMEHKGWNNFHQCPLILLSQGSVEFYAAWEKGTKFEPQGEEGKFVVIGTERTRMSHGGHVTVNLLLVDVDASGVSRRRKRVTYVLESDWSKLVNEWELVCLA